MSAESPTGTPISPEDDADEAGVRQFIEQASKQAAADTAGIDPDAIVAKVLEGLTPQLNTLLDKRVSGFQTALTENQRVIQEQAEKLREYEAAGLSEDERASLAQQQRDEEIENLRLQNELYRLRDQFPEGAGLYQRLIEGNITAEQQVALLHQALTEAKGVQAPAPAAPAAAPAPAAPAVPVDHNNPRSTMAPDAEVTEDGQVMSEEIAMQLLRSTPKWPGVE